MTRVRIKQYSSTGSYGDLANSFISFIELAAPGRRQSSEQLENMNDL
jgi:hypothetical protein